MLQHAPYWFRVLGWRGKKHVVQHCMFRSICAWIMKANMLHEVVDPQHETASLNNENTFNSPVSFVSVHLTAEVDQAAEAKQAAEDEKEAAECWALSSWSRVCSLHGQRFLDTSRHTLHEFTKLILKRYPIISRHITASYPITSHHIPSYPIWPQNQMFHIVSWCFYFLLVFVLYNLSISKAYNTHSCWANKLKRSQTDCMRSCWDVEIYGLS